MNLQNLGMIEIGEGLYAKVVSKGNHCTMEFNKIRKEVGKGFRYICISQNEPEKLNGYDEIVADIDVDWKHENLIILKL